jgi:hypothetical protein
MFSCSKQLNIVVMANTFYPIKSGEAIIEGPSKFDLMNSLFKKDERIQFSVKNENGKVVFPFLANAITAEDGSRERWIIEGYTFNTNKNCTDSVMKVYYDCRSRTGSILVHTKVA